MTVEITKLIPGGQALGTHEDGRKIFFWNALPGEIVTDYLVTKKKSHYYEALATTIKNPSPHRVEPKDACYLSTSPWQILSYEYELKQKQSLVQEIFREHQIDINEPTIITDGNDYFYRNKMEYALYWDHETSQISLAFHMRGSHRKIPITSSSIEHSEIFTAATKIVTDLNARHEEARKYQSLLLRCNQKGEISGGLYENHQPHPVFQKLSDTLLGHTYSYSPNGFFQINLPIYEKALITMKNHIKTEAVLDLYSGVGTIGLSVAEDHQLTLVECDKYAFKEMENNISNLTPGHSLANIHPILAKSEEALEYITNRQTVILDPPRAGCNQALISKLLDVKPPKIIYLSCNPATQARDVRLLLKRYKIEDVKTFNFFPHTPHIENLVVLSTK